MEFDSKENIKQTELKEPTCGDSSRTSDVHEI